jgi:hypothetical protein
MTAILAPHHSDLLNGFYADRYGNDPYVWTKPFLWSHCHARSRPVQFGLGLKGPTIKGKDVVFFLSNDGDSKQIVCDCVFVIAAVLPIAIAAKSFPENHAVQHYHFDQERSSHHKNSTLTRIADPLLSFVPHPPMPIGAWIEEHVETRSMSVIDYFQMKKRKNVRIVTKDVQGIYDRLEKWVTLQGHGRLDCLPSSSLKVVKVAHPANNIIDWTLS